LSPAETKLRALSMEELDRRIAEYGNVPKRKLRVGDRAEMTVLQAEKERRKQEGMARLADIGKRSAPDVGEPESTVPSGLFTMSDAQLEKRIAEYDEKDNVGLYALVDERARRTVSMKRSPATSWWTAASTTGECDVMSTCGGRLCGASSPS